MTNEYAVSIPMLSIANRLIAILAALSLVAPFNVVAQPGPDVAPAPPTAGAPPAVVVRVSGGITNAAIDYIAQIGEPTFEPIPAGASALIPAEAKCGNDRHTYLDAVLRRNPALAIDKTTLTTGQGGTLELPACARFEQHVAVTLTKDQKVADLLTEATGYAGGNTVAQFKAENLKLGSGITAATVLASGQTVTLPYRSEPTTVKLIDNPIAALDKVLPHLNQLFAGTEMFAASNPLGTLVKLVADADFLDSTEKCPKPDPPLDAKSWPIAPKPFLIALQRTAVESDAIKRQLPEVRIAVLDSGFPSPPQPPFLDARMATKPPLGLKYYGVNGATGTGPPFAAEGDPEANHGTEVAILALGGTQFLEEDVNNISHLRLRMERIIDVSNQGAVYENFVVNALMDALAADAQIVNASFQFENDMAQLRGLMNVNDDLLIVTAAGNDHLRPADSPRYPTNFGGDRGTFRAHVITVGASTMGGDIAPFSARGADYVDVLAPGCDVPSLGLKLDPRSDNGTSLSAPLVTFYAALVKQMGVVSTLDIRRRLLTSADPRSDLYSQAYSAGVINPLKLIDLHQDQVELTSGEIRRGTIYWLWQADKTPVCLDSDAPSGSYDVVKLGRLLGSTDWLMMWVTRGSNDLHRCRAKVPNQDLDFTPMDSHDTEPLNLATVKDIIVRALDDDDIRAKTPELSMP